MRFLNPFRRQADRRSPRTNRRRPRLESLETRQLMAGDVTASITNGTLVITGDAEANHIEIEQLADGSIQIQNTEPYDARYPFGYYTGGSAVYSNSYYTLINGAHSANLRGSFQSISISMGGENDSVDLHHLSVSGDLRIKLGSGADELDVDQVSVGDDLYVWTEGVGGWGRDMVDIQNTTVGNSRTRGNDLVVYGTSSLESVYVHDVVVDDDLLLLLTKQGEADRAYLYESVQVNGDYYGGTARVDSDYLYVRNLDVADDGDFRAVNRLYAYDSVFGDDLWVAGTDQANSMRFTNIQAAGQAKVDALGGNDYVRVYGTKGFTLNGGDGDDDLHGGSGNDTLNGGAGDDELFGHAGVDALFGGDDNDWLEAGSRWEVAEGGNGLDFNAHKWTLNGQAATDIQQTQSSRCVILAAMAGAVDRGVDLAGRINYLGNFRYRVKLFDPAVNSWVDVEVTFDGTLAIDNGGSMVDSSPRDTDADSVNEFWALLYQRAYVQHFYNTNPLDGEAVGNLPGEAFHHRAIQSLTGWSVSQHDWWLPVVGYLKTDATLFNELQDAVDSGDIITLGATGHAYYVKDVFVENGQRKVRIYNPWGTDSVHNTSGSANPDATGIKFEADGNSDGMMTVLISDIRRNFHRYFRSHR